MQSRELELEKPKPGLIGVDGREFPLESAKIHASAQGGIAQTTLRQAYRNPYDEPLEVTYTLPLPADGAVVGFDIRVGEKLIVGEVETHDKALRKYRDALETGRMAGILEQDRADTFTQNLGNVPPKTAVDVEIRILHPVTFHSPSGGNPAEWEYRFPTGIGVRYEGEPGRVKDRGRLDVNRADSGGTPARLTLELEIGDGASADVMPCSTSHEIRVESGADGAITLVRFDAPSRLDRDVAITWRAATADVDLRLVEGSGLNGDKGRYGLLTILPPNRADRIVARDLTLLIDASGSMSGPSIDAARELSSRLVGSLGPRDRVQILAFANEVEKIVGEPADATPQNIEMARQALAGLRASGSTEMAKAVVEALRPLRAESQRQVVLMTDGLIGFEQEVVQKIMNHLPPGARLHVVGIGSAPNRTLTRGGSRAGRGVEVLVNGPEAIEEAAARLLAATVAPVLTDIVIAGSAVVAVAPERPRDVLAGQPLVVALELSPKGGEVRVGGIMQGSIEGWTRSVEVSAIGKGSKTRPKKPVQDEPPAAARQTGLPIGALFGREAIEDEEMKLAAAAEGGKEILRRIEALGLRHRITSRCTNLVAVAEEPSVDPSKPRRRQRLVVEMPAGINPEAVGYGKARTMGQVCLSAPTSPTRFSQADAGVESRALRADSHNAKMLAPRERPTRPEITARCIRTDGDLLVIEFESPRSGFRLVQDGPAMTVITEDGEEVSVSIDKSLSTAAGPHPLGVTLRLGLRRVDRLTWKPGRVRLVSKSSKTPEIVVDIA